jgi:hypothetical protein
MVGKSSTIACMITSPERDDTFEMYLNGAAASKLTAENRWHSAGFKKFPYGSNSVVIMGYVRNFTVGHNNTRINCTSTKYNRHIAMQLRLRSANSTDHNQTECKGGQKWNKCGSKCTRTCKDKNPECTKECVPRCECVGEAYLWHEGKCVDRCPAQEVCKGLPEIAGLITETKFPVNAGTKINVGCKDGKTLKGNNWIQCVGGYKYNFGEVAPRCVDNSDNSTSDSCTSLPDIDYLVADTKFPVKAGTEFKVKCKDGWKLKGNHVFKCKGGNKFDYGEVKPRCEKDKEPCKGSTNKDCYNSGTVVSVNMMLMAVVAYFYI